jgi:diguanylate cyclase (GGDEF)-like protein
MKAFAHASCPSYDCEIKKLCGQMHKLGLGKSIDWMAVILFVRNLVGDFSIFTPEQKQAIQERVLGDMGKAGNQDEHLLETLGRLEEFIARNARTSALEQRLSSEQEAASALLQSVSGFLRDALVSEQARGQLVDAYGRRTLEALDSGEGLDTLAPRLRGMIVEMLGHYRDAAHHWEQKARLLEQTLSIDPLLAPLHNRNGLDNHMRLALERTRAEGTPLSVLMIDVDNFKLGINDRYGHQVGDDVLRALAKIVHAHASASGCFAARFGGDELVMVCALPMDRAVFQAQAVRLAVENYEFRPRIGDRLQDTPIRFTVSIGAAELHPGWSAEQLLDAADQAMYEVKGRRGNSVARFRAA